MMKSEWNKAINQIIRDAHHKCIYCGKNANSVHGVRGNHNIDSIVVVCKECHDRIHNEERTIYRIHRGNVIWNKDGVIEAAPRTHRVRAKAAKPSYDDIPEGC